MGCEALHHSEYRNMLFPQSVCSNARMMLILYSSERVICYLPIMQPPYRTKGIIMVKLLLRGSSDGRHSLHTKSIPHEPIPFGQDISFNRHLIGALGKDTKDRTSAVASGEEGHHFYFLRGCTCAMIVTFFTIHSPPSRGHILGKDTF